MTLLIETRDTLGPERDYILGVVLSGFLGLSWQRVPSDRADTRITLQGYSGEIRMPDIFFQTPYQNWLTYQSLPSQPLPVWDTAKLGLPITLVDEKLPIIYGDFNYCAPTFAPYSSFSNTLNLISNTCIPIDVFGSAFFMLTRYEEILKPDRDEHERFPAYASLAFQEGFLLRPVVDEYVEVLWAAMKMLWPGLERRKHEYRVILTHDVDRPFGVKGEPWKSVLRRFGGDFARRRNPGMAARRTGAFLFPGQAGERLDPNNTFDWIMDQSEKQNLKSEFYFMAGKTSNYDSGYDVFAPRIQRLLRRIHERGHVIGLHPSYDTLCRSDLLASEAENLRRAMDTAGATQELRGGRQHYLRWQAKCTWKDWDQAGLKEDSSVGFAQHVGFRAGTCRNYPAWSWQDDKPLGLVERPLIAMEASMMSEKYMALDEMESLKMMEKLSEAVDRVGGSFTFLWHNDSFNNLSAIRVYQQLLTGSLS